MQHQHNGGSGRGGRSREQGSSRDDATLNTSSSAAGRDPALQQEASVPPSEWNNSEWRRWDENHGHMLWMGTLQALVRHHNPWPFMLPVLLREDWNNATIAGFFRHHGADITVTRKGQDNYCFVAFASTEKAKNFMARYNHQPLPGKPGTRFNIRPRTRPRWYREAEHRSTSTGGGGGGDRGEGDHSNRNGNDNGNPRDQRLESGADGRVARKRQQFRGVKTERGSHQSHHTHQARRVGSVRPEDRGHYGPGAADPGLGGGGPDRGVRKERPPGMTPSSRQREAPDHDSNTRVFCRNNSKLSWRGRSRSRSWSRSPPRSRLRPRSGSSPPSGGNGDGSRRSSRSQDSVQTRRHYDPSFDHGSHWAPSNASAASRDSLRSDGSLAGGEGGRLPPGSDNSGVAVDRGGSDGYGRAKRSVTAVNTSTNLVFRTEGCAGQRSDIESGEVAGRGPCRGGAEGVGRGGQNSVVLGFANDSQVNSHHHAALDSDGGGHESDSRPKQGGEEHKSGFHGGEEHKSAEPTTTLDGGELTTRPPQHSESGIESSNTGQEKTFEEHPVREDNSPSPSTAGGEGCWGQGKIGYGLATGESSPGRFNQTQSPTRSHEASFTPTIGLEGGARAGNGDTSRIQDGPPDEDRNIDGGLIPADGPLNQQFDGRTAEDANLANTIHTWEAAEPADRQMDTAHLASALCSDSGGWVAGGRGTSNEMHHHRSTREEEGAAFEGMKGKGILHKEETRHIRTSPLPPPTASPSCQQPQRGSRQQVDTGTCAAPRTGSSPLFSDAGGGLDQSEGKFKESSTIDSICDPTLSRNHGGSGRDPRSNGGSWGDRSVEKFRLYGSRMSRASPVFEPPTKQEVAEGGLEGGSWQNPPMPTPRRGTKRRNTADITLAQVIEHHMARRRLNGVASGPEGSLAEPNSPCRSASSRHHISSTEIIRGKNRRLNGNWPSSTDAAASTQSPRSEGSTIVAAAWANGCVLPLTAAAAPHMRLVEPLLAAEPEGRRVVVRTAAAVAAAASILALPEHRLEVTGVCRDGLLLELHPKDEGKHGSGSPVQRKGSEKLSLLSALAGQLQATFDGLVALDLKFDTVRLPQGEAVDTMATSSSSVELLKWLNEGTTTLLRLAPAPSSTGASSVDQTPRGGNSPGLVELRKALTHQGGVPFLGIDCGLWPLLPRTGLLGGFSVGVRPVVLPPLELTGGGNRAHRSPAVHLAVTLSDSGIFHGHSSGSLGVLHGDGCQSKRSTGGLLVANAHDTEGGVVTSDTTVADLSQLDARRLGCVPPTCTANGLTWRDVTGLRCVAAVNRLALGSQKELEGKIQLAEGLHTAQIKALAKKIAFSGALLVILAGRQGASADVVASRLCVELKIKGKNPATLNTKEYLRPGAPQSHIAAEMGHRQPISNSQEPSSHQHLNSAALGGAVAALVGQARAGVGLSVANNGGNSAAAGGAGGAGPGAPAAAWPWCDVVVVYGCEALDVELLQPGGFGLGPAEAVSVFVDLVPQVCVDSLTPVNGADVRMLRALLTARGSFSTAAEAAAFEDKGGDGSGGNILRRRSSFFGTNGFLNEWFATEEREESLCRSFRATANVHVNTALPYDLNVLKPLAEPLLRSVAPPTSGHGDSGGGGDACRSSTYALSRSMLRLLQLCEALPAGGASPRYKYSPQG